MTARVRAFVGVMTTLIFLGIAVTLFLEERYAIGAVLGALGLLRGSFAIRQIQAVVAPDEDDDA